MSAIHDRVLLPRYGELIFRVESSRLVELASALERQARGTPWERSVEHEQTEMLRQAESLWTVFIHRAEPGALLFLVADGDRVSVANIVPTERSRLTEDEYNALLHSFADTVGRPTAEDLGVRLAVDTEPYDLAAELGERAYGLLSTSWVVPNSMMEDRFRSFLVAAEELPKSERPEPARIGEWLEAQGWEPGAASEWVLAYEQGLALLDHARRAG